MIKPYLINISFVLLLFFSCNSDDNTNNNTSTNVPTSELIVTIDENPFINTELGIIEEISNTENISFSISKDSPSGALDIIDATGQLFVKDSVPFNYEKNSILYATANVFRQYTNSSGGSEVDLIRKTTIEIHLNDVYEKYSFIGSKSLSTQQDVENFGNENHWGISGTLYISSTIPSDIHDLTPLSSIRNYGSLKISKIDLITSLNGISIDSLNQSITLSRNSQLANIDALSELSKINKDLIIYHNNSLQSLAGIENITEVNGDVLIYDHSSLLDINGLNGLQYVFGDLKIFNNGLLSNLCGVETLINNNGLEGEYNVEGNWYNPTQQDIIDGNCSN